MPYARIKRGEKHYRGANGDRARKYLAYREVVQWGAKAQRCTWFNEKRLALDVAVYLKKIDDTTRGDGDNYFKSIADSLQGVAYENDKTVTKGSFELLEDANERVEIEIERG